MKALVICLALASAPLAAEEMTDAEIKALPPALRSYVIKSAAECAEVNNGLLTVSEGAVARHDLDRDGDLDWILSSANFSCDTSMTLFCSPSGYCPYLLGIEDSLEWISAFDLEVLEAASHTVVLAWVHGSACDGIGATLCARAHVWDGTRWTTVDMPE